MENLFESGRPEQPAGPGTAAAGRAASRTEGSALRSDSGSAPERSLPPPSAGRAPTAPRSVPRPRPGHSHGAEPAGPGPAASNRAELGALRPVPAAPLRSALPRRTGRAHPPRCGDNAAGIRPAARAPPHFRDTPVTSRYARARPAPHFRPQRGALIGSGRTRASAARTAEPGPVGRAGAGKERAGRRGGSGRQGAGRALDTVLFYYGKGEKATSAQQATSKIYPKNNSVQNGSASELKKTFT